MEMINVEASGELVEGRVYRVVSDKLFFIGTPSIYEHRRGNGNSAPFSQIDKRLVYAGKDQPWRSEAHYLFIYPVKIPGKTNGNHKRGIIQLKVPVFQVKIDGEEISIGHGGEAKAYKTLFSEDDKQNKKFEALEELIISGGLSW